MPVGAQPAGHSGVAARSGLTCSLPSAPSEYGITSAPSTPRAAIIAAVSAFRQAAAAGATSWQLARQRLPGAYQAMLDQVEVTVAEQPLLRLQAVGSGDTVFPFLYELSWGARASFSPARLRRHGPRGPAIRLLPGAGEELLRLAPLIRPLVELHWTGWSRRSTR